MRIGARKLLLLVASVTVTLLGIELFLGWNDRRPSVRDYAHAVTLNGTPYRFFETPANLSRTNGAILITGDSFTAGVACADNRNYPSAFTEAAKRSGARLHGINLGVGATGPMAYALRIRDYFEERGPTSGVILTLYANDVDIDCTACRHLEEWAPFANLTPADRDALKKMCARCLDRSSPEDSNAPAEEVTAARRLHWWLQQHSNIYKLFREAGATVGAATGWYPVDWGRGAFPAQWSDPEGLHFKYLRGAIGVAKREADRFGVRIMAVVYPDLINITSSNQFVEIYRTAGRALTSATGIPVRSGYEAFLGDPRTRTRMPYSLTDAHPSCAAHSIFGQWVFSTWRDLDRPRTGL